MSRHAITLSGTVVLTLWDGMGAPNCVDFQGEVIFMLPCMLSLRVRLIVIKYIYYDVSVLFKGYLLNNNIMEITCLFSLAL